MLIPFLEVSLFTNSSHSIAFYFSLIANLFFRLFISIFKFPIFKLTIAMVGSNSIGLFACINFVATSSIDFGVLVYVVGFLDPSIDDPTSCTNLLPSPNSNGNPYANLGLVINTYSSDGLNITKEGYVSILSICSPIAYRPSYVYRCCCCKCCGLTMVSI